MVVARAGGEGAHQRRGAGRGRSCPHQWRARKSAGTRRGGWRRGDERARSQPAHSEGGQICGVRERECTADAIKPGTEPGMEKWLEVNTEYAKSWPNITQKKESPPDAKDFEGMEGKFEKFFSPAPGTGD